MTLEPLKTRPVSEESLARMKADADPAFLRAETRVVFQVRCESQAQKDGWLAAGGSSWARRVLDREVGGAGGGLTERDARTNGMPGYSGGAPAKSAGPVTRVRLPRSVSPSSLAASVPGVTTAAAVARKLEFCRRTGLERRECLCPDCKGVS